MIERDKITELIRQINEKTGGQSTDLTDAINWIFETRGGSYLKQLLNEYLSPLSISHESFRTAGMQDVK